MNDRLKRFMHIIKRVPSYFFEIICILIFYPISKCIYGKRNIWLISERGDEARDNGMHLFKYIRRVYPEKNVYYVIKKNAVDIRNIVECGNILYKDTIKHRMMFYASKVCISTHLMGGYTTNEGFYCNVNRFRYVHNKKKFVSVKHGITKDDLPVLYYENSKLDLLIAGAKPEYEYMLKQFKYPEEKLKYTGFARFDNLFENEEKNQILIMPTWRMYLSGKTGDEFRKSEFYIRWNSLLNNDRLTDLLIKNDIKLVFYPHYEIQKHIHEFESKCSQIVLADSNHFDVQNLLKESKILITDYSSVYFDFAYMSKPVVYYQFDRSQYLKGHYKKGYYDYEKMGFGLCTSSENDVVNEIMYYVNNNYKIKEKYEAIIKQFFPLRDNNNCKRITDEIIRMSQGS